MSQDVSPIKIRICNDNMKEAFKIYGNGLSFEIFSRMIQNINNHKTFKDDNHSKIITINMPKNTIYATLQKQKGSTYEMTIELDTAIKHVHSKKRKKKKKKTTVSPDARFYDAKPYINPENGVVTTVKGNIEISHEMTEEILPSKTKQNIDDFYVYIKKMLPLQFNPVIHGNKWVLNFNIHCIHTGQLLFCIAHKIPIPEKARGFKWKLMDVLYTSKEICDKLGISETQLPKTLQNTPQFICQIQNVKIMEQIFNDSNQISKIFNIKKPWQVVPTFKNDSETNKDEKKRTIIKPKFLEILTNVAEAGVELIPILLFRHTRNTTYSIDGLWNVLIDENTNIGISFKMNEMDRTIMPTGYHVNMSEMKVHCQLVNDEKTIDEFFNGWSSTINTFAVGNPKKWQNHYNQKTVEYNKLLDKYDNAMIAYEKLLEEHEKLKKQVAADKNETKQQDVQSVPVVGNINVMNNQQLQINAIPTGTMCNYYVPSIHYHDLYQPISSIPISSNINDESQIIGQSQNGNNSQLNPDAPIYLNSTYYMNPIPEHAQLNDD